MGHPSRSVEDSSAEGCLNCADLAQDVSEKKNICMSLRDSSCNILAKNMTSFCPCSNNLHETKLKSLGEGGIALAKKISKQPCIDSRVVIGVHAYEDL